jgi:lipid II:glycine glycyltransferase (peptidoglycan interpeptide bridge formation enzyme)
LDIKNIKFDNVCTNNFSLIEEFLKKNFSSPTHWPDWNLVISKYFNTSFYYFTANQDSELIGICPIHKVKDKLFEILWTGPKHFLIPYGGWIFNKEFQLNTKNISLSFNQSYQGFGLPLIQEFNVSYKAVKKNEFKTLLIDLTDSEDDIWNNNVDSKRRNMIRKALKNEVKIEIDTKNNLDFFYDNFSEANKRYGLETYKKDFFLKLFSSIKNINMDIFWAKQGEQTLSGAVLAYDKNYAIYWLGFGIENAPNLGQGELIQWDMIKYSKSRKCKYYDLCSVEKEKLPKIYEFKKGFSKREEIFLNFIESPVSYKILRRIF